jgi:Ca2+-binding RTX toxin-like protein
MATIPTNFYQGTGANEKFDVGGDVPVIVDGADGNDFINGGSDRDTLYGGNNTDVIKGNQGNDTIYGDGFPDYMGGRDQLFGGTYDDLIYGGGGVDYVNGGDGYDILHGDRRNDFLVGGLDWDTIYGGHGGDVMYGNGIIPGHEVPVLLAIQVVRNGISGAAISPPEVFGGDLGEMPLFDDKAIETMYGGWGNDIIYGQGGDDYLWGEFGKDFLAGGRGHDLLTGGLDRDWFAFSEYGKFNHDYIADFGEIDRFALDVSVFTRIGKAGEKLDPKFFHVGGKPQTPQDRVIFNEDAGALFYDRDGSKDGFIMKKFAFIGTHVEPNAAQFDLI